MSEVQLLPENRFYLPSLSHEEITKLVREIVRAEIEDAFLRKHREEIYKQDMLWEMKHPDFLS